MNRSRVLATLIGSSLWFARAAEEVRASHSAGPATADPARRSGLAAVLSGSTWIGERPTAEALAGRTVLVDVFTFECINCTRVVPNIKRVRARYSPRELVVVAVHTPEVPSYQGTRNYVAREAASQSITWPIVLDNDYRIWTANGVDAWPTQLVFDRHGRLRDRIVGDANDGELDAAIARVVGGA